MGLYTGSGGKVTLGATDLDAIDWTLETSIQLADKTELGSTWKSYVTGIKDWSATVNAIQKTETDPLTNWAQSAASLKLYIDDTYYFEGDGICTSATVTETTEDTVKITFNFVCSDQLAAITFS